MHLHVSFKVETQKLREHSTDMSYSAGLAGLKSGSFTWQSVTLCRQTILLALKYDIF